MSSADKRFKQDPTSIVAWTVSSYGCYANPREAAGRRAGSDLITKPFPLKYYVELPNV